MTPQLELGLAITSPLFITIGAAAMINLILKLIGLKAVKLSKQKKYEALVEAVKTSPNSTEILQKAKSIYKAA